MILAESVVKRYGTREILSDLSLDIAAGESVALVGPSGCGKTTLLNIISGLDEPDGGRTEVAGDSVHRVGYMMQESALLPWRTLAQNATLGADVAGPADPPDAGLLDMFRAFDLVHYEDAYPSEASAGMRQRVALMRTLLFGRRVFLLDEPFSNLDFDIKLRVQRFILRFQRGTGATLLMVTHDIEDAIALSDRIYVLSDKPTRVKAVIQIQPELGSRDPVEARKSLRFREFFAQIADQLKYLGADE